MDPSPRRAGLSDARRALLEKRLRGEASSLRPREVVGRVAGPGPEHPASFAQERMWFLSRFMPGSPIYNIPVAVLVPVGIDVRALERALTVVVRRHEALRTTFRMDAGELKQVVHPPFPVQVEVLDVRHRVGPDFARDVEALVAEEGSRPFDLARLPLSRVTLLRVSDEHCALVTTVHHIVADGWGCALVNREVFDLYEGYVTGSVPELPEPTLRYADYAVWQRRHLTGETLEKQVSFWREHLRGAPPLELPGDRPRPPALTYRGRFHRFRVPPDVTRRLREVCRQEAATLNMVVMAAFYVLLRKYSGQDDLVVGTLLGSRGRAELERVVGMFVNTAALRIDLSGDPVFRDVVRRTKRLVLEADLHQDLPFEKLVDLLGVERDLSRHPVFQALYFHQTFVRSHFAEGGGDEPDVLPTRPISPAHDLNMMDTGVAKFDLQLTTLELGEGLSAFAEYSTDLFDPATMARMCRHFVTLLDRAGRAPDSRLSELSLLGGDERRTLLEEWGAGPALDVPSAPLHRRFEAQAARTPDALAVVAGSGRLTYREMDAWANRIAAELRSRGAAPGAIVGVALERSAAMVAALLGILKSGAAYLPLDPSYPAERVAFMLEDSGAALVLADAPAAPLPVSGARVIPVPAPPAPGEAVAPVSAGAAPGDRAYLVYTSGSTGRPKAVEVEHRNLSHLLASVAHQPGMRADDVTLAVTTISFDVSVPELFLPLATGARVVVAGPDEVVDGRALARLMEAEGVTVMQATPAAWRLLVRSGWEGRPGLRAVATGEALTAELAEALLSRAGEVWNLYGPTEITVWATAHRVTGPGDGIVPIGRPMANVSARVLDRAGEPSPVGVPGELYVGGGGVARGYLGRPGLTADRFVPDPFSPAPGARMYRTGDRVRWRADGTLEYLGRTDFQVKLRGHRVELGEIESVLLRHPAVAAAAALVREDVPGDQRLVAYFVPAAGSEAPSADGLRAWLRKRLPEYMVPGAFVALESLPTTTSGKVDRRALPVPEAPEAAEGGYVAPRNLVEEMLAGIWAEVLRREPIGVTDNFFQLGGHSLLATQVISRVAQTFAVELPIRGFFAAPTIAGLAEAIEAAGSPVLAQMVAELEGLSAEEVEALLAE
ncbi:MAG TPA: amino acid adenylation domain-containing protein [Longimicrobium sp.]|jgi:amino acid adenylation domain-containing protein